MTFNRLDKKNAFTAAMYQIMADALKEAEEDARMRVILLLGQPHIFSVGTDIEDFLSNPPDSPISPIFQFLWQIIYASKPVVAPPIIGGRCWYRHDVAIALRSVLRSSIEFAFSTTCRLSTRG